MRIGLLGGSFDPPHEGHRLASLIALRRLRLDRVWWLVTPGNPLKDTRALAPLPDRMEACRQVKRHRLIEVSDIEARLGTRYTLDTIQALRRRAPTVRFVWLMGADNLAGFHRWRRWRCIANLLPLAIVDRPGSTLRAVRSRAAVSLGVHRLRERDAGRLAERPAPAWVFLHGPRSPLSSTRLRAGEPRRTTPP